MREPNRKSTRNTSIADDRPQPSKETAIEGVLTAGAWIAHAPLALFVILAGVLLDSVIRLFLTFTSSYFRLIDLPAASYGLIWAALGALGFFVSPVARRMVQRGSPAENFGWVAVVTLTALLGLALVGCGIHFPAWCLHGRDWPFLRVLSERPSRIAPAREDSPFFQRCCIQSRLRLGKPAFCLPAQGPA
jgi:hypothetical protein